jgi:hypothetical protein
MPRPGRLHRAHLVAVPVLEQLVFADRPEVVRVFFESDLHHALVVREKGLVTVAEVQSPDLDVLVGRAGDNQL